jgi:hypothetical protein
MKNDLPAAMKTIESHAFEKYRGCLIERKGGKFIWAHKIHDTLDEAKRTIDQALEDFNKKDKLQ